jgi:hypothetical protein
MKIGVKMKYLISLLVPLLYISCATHDKISKNSDAYFENITKKFLSNNDKSQAFVDFLKSQDLELFQSLQNQKTDCDVKNLWGKSINFDSGAKKQILDENIIQDIQNICSVKNDNKIVSAGLMHTYGYLFSTLQTPYGYKRKRWIDPTINYGFNFNGQSISPYPLEGTLLSNLTYFAGRLAFSEKTNLSKLEDLKFVSKEVKSFDYKKVEVTLLEEVISYPQTIKTLRTHFVKFKSKLPNEENDFILIYSVFDQTTKIEQLITVFPIKMDAYLKSIDNNSLGDDRPILVRYNGDIGPSSEVRLSGKRSVLRNL